MEIIQENTQEGLISDMVNEIRQGEQEEQEFERDGEGEGDEPGLERPSIGRDIKPGEPAPRREYTPIRNRKPYKELLRSTAKAMSFLEHVTNRRPIYNVEDEAAALSEVSKASYKAMKYIEERLEERKKEKNETLPLERKDIPRQDRTRKKG